MKLLELIVTTKNKLRSLPEVFFHLQQGDWEACFSYPSPQLTTKTKLRSLLEVLFHLQQSMRAIQEHFLRANIDLVPLCVIFGSLLRTLNLFLLVQRQFGQMATGMLRKSGGAGSLTCFQLLINNQKQVKESDADKTARTDSNNQKQVKEPARDAF